MKRNILIASLCLYCLPLAMLRAQDAPVSSLPSETAAQHDARMAWWREARFGMFVHWGVYSYLGGDWQGKPYNGYAEHIQRMAKIPIPVYRQEVAGHFNPANFNADEWIRRAKETGMGYFIITAKHHDGFAMWPTKVNDYNVVDATPWHHDPMADLRAACKKNGVKFGFYYSHAFDWGDENAPGNDWDYNNPGGDKSLHGAKWWEKDPEFLAKARKYVDEKAIPQILELIRDYDPDILWFDTPQKLPPEENRRVLAAVRRAKPSLLVNGRLVNGAGDYASTSDRPAEFPPHDDDWEGIPTTNESYGYNQNDHSHKTVAHFIRVLAKAAARGGNILMNIGPRGDGTFDPADLTILQGIGDWWQINGESIRGTTRTPLAVQAWGESTRKSNTLYLHVFDWPHDGKIVVGGLKTDVKQAWLLADKANTIFTKLKVTRVNPLDVRIEGLPKTAPDANDSVIVLDCVGEPQADKTRLLAANVGTNTLRAFDAKLIGPLQFGAGKKNSAWVNNWTSKTEAVVWPVRIKEKATYAVSVVYDAPVGQKSQGLVEGDAGKEAVQRHTGADGIFTVALGSKSFSATVQTGIAVRQSLGQVTLEPGSYEFCVKANEITGEELFRLQSLELVPQK